MRTGTKIKATVLSSLNQAPSSCFELRGLCVVVYTGWGGDISDGGRWGEEVVVRFFPVLVQYVDLSQVRKET